MSANPRMLPNPPSATNLHLQEGNIDWCTYEALATAELNCKKPLRFGDVGKKRIIEALRLSVSQGPDVPLETIKWKARDIYEIVKGGLPDHIILAGHNQWTPSEFMKTFPQFDKAVFVQMMANTFDDAQAGKSVKERVQIYRRLLRNGGRGTTIKIPRPEAMALYLVREAFLDCGMNAEVSHTRPIAAGEGNEKQSAFEKFAFDYIMPEIGSDDAAKKILLRRLTESERALDYNAKQ